MTNALPLAGWYPDPQDRQRLRYWGGTAWTDKTRERPTPTAPTIPVEQPKTPTGPVLQPDHDMELTTKESEPQPTNPFLEPIQTARSLHDSPTGPIPIIRLDANGNAIPPTVTTPTVEVSQDTEVPAAETSDPVVEMPSIDWEDLHAVADTEDLLADDTVQEAASPVVEAQVFDEITWAADEQPAAAVTPEAIFEETQGEKPIEPEWHAPTEDVLPEESIPAPVVVEAAEPISGEEVFVLTPPEMVVEVAVPEPGLEHLRVLAPEHLVEPAREEELPFEVVEDHSAVNAEAAVEEAVEEISLPAVLEAVKNPRPGEAEVQALLVQVAALLSPPQEPAVGKLTFLRKENEKLREALGSLGFQELAELVTGVRELRMRLFDAEAELAKLRKRFL